MSQEQYQFIFHWKIDNFLACFQKNGEYLKSPEFPVDFSPGSRWFITLYPRGDVKECEKYISIFLNRCEDDTGDEEILLNDRIDLVGDNEDVLTTVETKYNLYRRGTFHGIHKFCKIDKITDEMSHLKENSVTIRYSVTKSVLDVTEYSGWTKIVTDQRTFLWEVSIEDSPSWSPNKQFFFSHKTMFDITLFATQEDVLMVIRRLQIGYLYPSRLLKCRTSLLDTAGNENYINLTSFPFQFVEFGQKWPVQTLFPKSALIFEEISFLLNGKLTIKIELTCSERIVWEDIWTS